MLPDSVDETLVVGRPSTTLAYLFTTTGPDRGAALRIDPAGTFIGDGPPGPPEDPRAIGRIWRGADGWSIEAIGLTVREASLATSLHDGDRLRSGDREFVFRVLDRDGLGVEQKGD